MTNYAFWLSPDWSGGTNLRDPGNQPFWMLDPLPYEPEQIPVASIKQELPELLGLDWRNWKPRRSLLCKLGLHKFLSYTLEPWKFKCHRCGCTKSHGPVEEAFKPPRLPEAPYPIDFLDLQYQEAMKKARMLGFDASNFEPSFMCRGLSRHINLEVYGPQPDGRTFTVYAKCCKLSGFVTVDNLKPEPKKEDRPENQFGVAADAPCKKRGCGRPRTFGSLLCKQHLADKFDETYMDRNPSAKPCAMLGCERPARPIRGWVTYCIDHAPQKPPKSFSASPLGSCSCNGSVSRQRCGPRSQCQHRLGPCRHGA